MPVRVVPQPGADALPAAMDCVVHGAPAPLGPCQAALIRAASLHRLKAAKKPRGSRGKPAPRLKLPAPSVRRLVGAAGGSTGPGCSRHGHPAGRGPAQPGLRQNNKPGRASRERHLSEMVLRQHGQPGLDPGAGGEGLPRRQAVQGHRCPVRGRSTCPGGQARGADTPSCREGEGGGALPAGQRGRVPRGADDGRSGRQPDPVERVGSRLRAARGVLPARVPDLAWPAARPTRRASALTGWGPLLARWCPRAGLV